ncbi:phage tail tape measure protein [Streptomyces sp. NPDC050988]|uniref:phage tail tape measure protein n=1 Tax=Streptomyces sp. NPDC050988 TaxID=3365637 RepID=UPI003799111D
MSDTSLVFDLVARERVGPGLDAAQEKFDTAAAGIGAGVGLALGAGIMESLNVEAANDKLAAQLSLGPAEAADVAKVSASVYQNAWGDSTETVNLAIKGVYQNIGDTSQAEGGLEGVTTKALALAETFDQDLTMTTAAVGQLMRTGLADSADEAFDIITVGMGTSADKAGDFLETLNEYSVQFKRVGLDGQTATGLIAQGLEGGARDADQVADAIGQFGERALAGGTAVDDAYKSIGLSASDMARMIGAGGDSAEKALGMTLDALRGTGDEQVRLNAAAALFGDPANVMGDALYALDPATAAAAAGMDDAAGATDRLVEKAGSNATSQLESFKRKALGQLAEVAGGFVKFAMDNQAVFQPLAYVLLGLAGTVLAVKAAMITYAAVSSIVAGAHAIMSASTWGVIGNWMRMMAIGLGVYIRIAAGAVASALTTAAAWTGSALVSIGTWILAVIRAAVVSGAQFLLMAARAVAWATVMAAQWLIAMGPVGWVIAVIIGLVAVVVANWSTVKRWTAQAWGYVVGFVRGATTGVLTAVSWLSRIPGQVGRFFGDMKNAAVRKALDLVTWMQGLPGRLGRAVGGMGRLLVTKGADVIRGLWNGISGMGSWLWNKVKSFVSTNVVDAAKSFLQIGSPSKRASNEIGHWLPPGIAEGAENNRGVLDKTMAGLVDPQLAMPSTPLTSGMAPLMGGRGGGGVLVVYLDIAGQAFGQLWIDTGRRVVSALGGDVQASIGQRR